MVWIYTILLFIFIIVVIYSYIWCALKKPVLYQNITVGLVLFIVVFLLFYGCYKIVNALMSQAC